MRVVFLTPFGAEYRNVSGHTVERLRIWRDLGADVVEITIGMQGRGRRRALTNLLLDRLSMRDLVRRVSSAEPELIVLRWLYPIPGMIPALAGIAPVVLEVHASDLKELGRGRGARVTYLKAIRGRELRAAAGACFVTGELAVDPDFRMLAGPRGVFGNGTRLAERSEIPANERIRVGIAVGQSQAWNGLDRFSALARELQEFQFIVACPSLFEQDIRNAVGEEVAVVGTTTREEYLAELASWTVALGPLAAERSGRRVSTPLKVRDYVGLGVPTVLPYFDEALTGADDDMIWSAAPDLAEPYAEILPHELRRFVYAAIGRNVLRGSRDLVDIRRIETNRLALLRRIAQSGSG